MFNEELNCVFIRSATIHKHFKPLYDPYVFVTADIVQETMRELLTSDFYAKDMSSVRAVGRPPRLHPASSLGPRISEAALAESDAEDVMEASIDGDTSEKEVAVPAFDPQSATGEKKFRSAFFRSRM